MTYQEAESFLFTELQSFQDKGKVAYKSNLDNILALSEILGNPHQKFKSIHVAGTNGKGSVSHMIAAGIQAHGYRVGLYTSPHYKTYRERIKINREFIAEEEVAQFIQKYKEDIIQIKPSFFEITCAMAFDHFATHEVDVAIIEVGLGGRLDSTNIIDPLAAVVTNISYDHQHILGNSLVEIAGEKAGIFKPNITAIIGETQEELSDTFYKRAKEVGAPLFFAQAESSLMKIDDAKKHSLQFSINNAELNIQFDSQLQSPYHLKNLTTALYTLYHVKHVFDLSPVKIGEGIERIHQLTYFIGRWTKIQENPLVIMDSAHNLAGVQYLVRQIQNMNYKQLRIVWGTTKEKDVDEILKLLPKDAIYYFTQAQNARALDAEALRDQAIHYTLHGSVYKTVEAAYTIALEEGHEDDLIIVSGSSFVVAEVI